MLADGTVTVEGGASSANVTTPDIMAKNGVVLEISSLLTVEVDPLQTLLLAMQTSQLWLKLLRLPTWWPPSMALMCLRCLLQLMMPLLLSPMRRSAASSNQRTWML